MPLRTRKERIHDLMYRSGETLDSAAQKLGLSKSTFNGYVSYDSRRIPYEKLKQMAALFKTSVDYILSGIDAAAGSVSTGLMEAKQNTQHLSRELRNVLEQEKDRMHAEFERERELLIKKHEAEKELLRMEIERLRRGGR